MSAPAAVPAASVHTSKRKRSNRLSAAHTVSAISALSSDVVPPYTQVVPTDVAADVPPLKKSWSSRRSRVVSNESAEGHSLGPLPRPGHAAFHELPAVSISHPVGVASQTLHRRVSYGELGPDEVSAIDVPASSSDVPFSGTQYVMRADTVDNVERASSDYSDASCDASSESAAQNAFIDDIAEEKSDGSESASGEESVSGDSDGDTLEVAAGTAAVPVVSDSSVATMNHHVQPSPSVAPAVPVDSGLRASSRTKNKTERGRYVDTMIQNGLAQHVAGPGYVKDDPSVPSLLRRSTTCRPRFVPKPSAGSLPNSSVQRFIPVSLPVSSGMVASSVPTAAPPAAPVVYLEDLDGPPLPGSPKKRKNAGKGKVVPSVKPLPVQTDLLALCEPSLSSSTPVKTLVLSGEAAPFLSVSTGGIHSAVAAASGSVVAAASSVSGIVRPDGFFNALDALIGSTYDASQLDDDDIGVDPQASASGVTGHSDMSPPEPEDEGSRVMLIELQEEQLIEYYMTLPGLGGFQAMLPIGMTEDVFDQPPFIMFDAILRFFNIDALRSVMAARMFFGHSQFCSLSTMPLTAFSNDGRKLVCAACTAVPIIVGVVVGSSLVATTAVGGKTVHGVRLLPFIQPWRHETTALCTLFDVPVGHSEICTEGIDFSTRGLSLVNPSSNTNMRPSPLHAKSLTPAKTATSSGSSTTLPGRSLWPKSPSKPAGLKSRSPPDFYHCLGFEDEIPVFDGRASRGHHFLFRPSDFDQLATMPHIGPNKELDRFTLVAVGYTPSIWAPTPQSPRISLNAQFIVVLRQAPKPKVLVEAGYGPDM